MRSFLSSGKTSKILLKSSELSFNKKKLMNNTENNAMVNPPKNPKNPFNRLGRKLKSTLDSSSLMFSVRFMSYFSKYISKSETSLSKSASHWSI